MLPLINKLRAYRQEESRFATRWVQAVLGRQNGAGEVKRERWTESDVLSLPAGEHDYFERKGAGLLEDSGKFLDTVAKACSAFANSGGGSLLLGVEDDGTLTGVDPNKGKEPLRDWLEQKIPGLLDYGLSDFRVHVVEPAIESCIPAGKIVVVIDVGDSALAPHQSRRQKVYFHRVAGRSEHAPHFYLDLLRQRLASPTLEFSLEGIETVNAHQHEGGVFVELNMFFWIRNTGRAAAYRWRLRATEFDTILNSLDELKGRHYFDRSIFPVRSSRKGGISLDNTILPGETRRQELDLGVLLRPNKLTKLDVMTELSRMISDLVVTFQLATECSPGVPLDIALGEKADLEKIYVRITECRPELGLPA